MTLFLVKLEWGMQPSAGSQIKAALAHVPCPGSLHVAAKRNVWAARRASGLLLAHGEDSGSPKAEQKLSLQDLAQSNLSPPDS